MLTRTNGHVLSDTPASETVRSAHDAPVLTVFGGAAKLDGRFDIADSLQVDCEVAGELNVGGKLVIGAMGVVNADVHTVDILITGRYNGSLVATGNVEVTETGRVTGRIQTDSLRIARGGFFNGSVIKLEAEEDRRGLAPLYLVERKHAGLQS
jgi:cytoskeletal protein CcmA (bactofilin family)